MANRTVKFVSAIFASVLAGSYLTAVTNNSANAAEESCLSSPKGTAPEGGHWYYRIDRATKKQCWYLRNEKEKVAHTAPQEAGKDEPVQAARKGIKPASIADAHAELPMPQTRAEPDARLTVPRAIAPSLASTPAAESNRGFNAPENGRQQSAFVFASRWPESSGVNSSAIPAPSAAEQPPGQPPAAAPATAAITLAAADASLEKPSGSIQMLLIVIVGALAVAGMIGSVIFKFARAHPAASPRRAIWDPVPDHHSLAARYPMPRAHLPRPGLTDRHLAAEQPADKVTEMLARLARSAQT